MDLKLGTSAIRITRGLLLKPTLDLLERLLKRDGNSVIIGGPLGWSWEPTIDAAHHGSLLGPANAHRHSDLAGIGPDDHHARDHATRHQDGGADEINIAGLSGEPADTVNKSLFDAQTILVAVLDNSPQALTVNEQTVVGRVTGGNIASLSVSQLQTLLFSSPLLENVGIYFTEALSADGKYSGFVTGNFLAGETLSFGHCVYLDSSTNRWKKAQANAEATTKPLLGICVLAAADNGSATTILLLGKVRADTVFPSFTKYAPVFLNAAMAGALTSTVPAKSTGHCIRCVGQAISEDELFFNPSPDWFEYA